ncbi:MAG TPA: hypothetical protein VNM47_16050 [Terriglobia bacterium]|nr:hypothetical protein [Terriglobia bacterium]
MGHTRLGAIPKSRKWSAVVAELDNLESSALHGGPGAVGGVVAVAGRTLQAAETGMDRAVEDPGLSFAFYLLTQLALSARGRDWPQALRRFGIRLSDESSIFDLTLELQSAVDRHVSTHSHPNDISEMAQQAVGEAVAALATAESATLFGSGREELQRAIRSLSTRKGFSELGQVFFGRFTARFLNFYLSRLTGEKLSQIGDVSTFNKALQTHCEQSARVVRDFCGEWFSKTEYLEGITPENTSRFVAVAVKKLRSELRQQRSEP